MAFNGYIVSVWEGDDRILEMIMVMVAQQWDYLRPLNCTLKNSEKDKFYISILLQ